MQRRFLQVDVFASDEGWGNPVAVVLDGNGLSATEMQAFAAWTNLSETTFVMEPADPGSDYAVRIFTPSEELPFAGHPTLGTCHAWNATTHLNGRSPGRAVQECGLGLVPLALEGSIVAFAAPPPIRSGAVESDVIDRVIDTLGLAPGEIVDTAWVDNGPGWIGVLVASPEILRRVAPRTPDEDPRMIGVAALLDGPGDEGLEVRAFFTADGHLREDPVTGSLNASLAQWLVADGRIELPYTAVQGAAVGRAGRIEVSEAEGDIWVGGRCRTVVDGIVNL